MPSFNDTIYEACKSGDIKKIKDFLKSYKNEEEFPIYGSNMVMEAIKGNQFDIVKTIFDSGLQKDELNEPSNAEVFFSYASMFGSHQIYKFLFHHFEENETIFKRTMEITPRTIAHYGQLDSLKYLFANYSENELLQKNLKEGDILSHACMGGSLDIIKYILNDENLKQHVDIHIYGDNPFKSAYRQGKKNVMEYFIFDLDIELSKDIKEVVETDSDAFKMFSVRELAKSLEQDKPNNKTTRKVKI
jgi:ankyrin repeat protein